MASSMKYILVTHFEDHWDKLNENFTSFPKLMLSPDLMRQPIAEGTETIFIKRNEHSGTIERCWTGTVRDIKFLRRKVFFRVEIWAERTCPAEFVAYPDGWFYESGNL